MQEKIKVEEFNRVCRLAGLSQVKSDIPIWKTTSGKSEAVELKNNKIVTFCMVGVGERQYDQVIESSKINAVLGAFEPKQIEEKASKKAHDDMQGMGSLNKNGDGKIHDESEKAQETTPIKENEKNDTSLDIGIFPSILTPTLITKWAQMTTTDRILMFQKTPRDEIYQVVVGKNQETGKNEMASYVKGNFMVREANAAFLFRWRLDVHEISISETGVSCRGTIWGYFSEYGCELSRPACGYQERNKKIDAQQAQKGACTDAIKKGLSLFGFNSDVYSGEV